MSKSKNGTRINIGDVWYAKIGDGIALDEIRLEEITEQTVCFALRTETPAALRQRASSTAWTAPRRYAISDIKFIELKSASRVA
jgi:hypothetical protein